MMCPTGMGIGPKLLAPLVIMSLAYFVMVTAAKQSKGLKILGLVIGIVTILLTGLMFAKAVINKCVISNSQGRCPITGMKIK